jgi:hypothetical protein
VIVSCPTPATHVTFNSGVKSNLLFSIPISTHSQKKSYFLKKAGGVGFCGVFFFFFFFFVPGCNAAGVKPCQPDSIIHRTFLPRGRQRDTPRLAGAYCSQMSQDHSLSLAQESGVRSQESATI